MRIASLSRLALIAALIVAAGCSGNKGKIENTAWASRAATIKGKPLPPGAQVLQFRPDGHLVKPIDLLDLQQMLDHYTEVMRPQEQPVG